MARIGTLGERLGAEGRPGAAIRDGSGRGCMVGGGGK